MTNSFVSIFNMKVVSVSLDNLLKWSSLNAKEQDLGLIPGNTTQKEMFQLNFIAGIFIALQ